MRKYELKTRGIMIFVFSLLISLLITGCDDRGGEKPTLTVSFDRDKLYGAGADCNINHSRVTFIMEGSPSFTKEAKLLVEYDKLRGVFVGTGSSDYIITQNDGTAIGTYMAYPNAYGSTAFTVIVDRFRDVKETVVINLYDIPEIELTADEYDIHHTESTKIYVKLTDQADNTANIPIKFTTNSGLLVNETVYTDDSGKAENIFEANEQIGNATVRAALGFCHNEYKEIVITRQ